MNKPKNWKVYIIQTKSGKLYTGTTTDINRRWSEHNNKKGAKYFRLESPKEIVHTEDFKNRQEAAKREHEIKRLNRKEKLKLIKGKIQAFMY